MPLQGSHNWKYYGSKFLAIQFQINVPTLARNIEEYGIASHVHGEPGPSNHVHPPFKSAEFPTPVPRVQLFSHHHLRGRKHSYLIDPLQHVLISRLGPAGHLIGHVFARKRGQDRWYLPHQAQSRNLTGFQGASSHRFLASSALPWPMFIRAISANSHSSLVRSTIAVAPSRRSMPRILRPLPLTESYHIMEASRFVPFLFRF